MKKIEAVIFDMDGLMIDSEPLHCFAFNQVLNNFGYKLTQEENNARYVGLGDVACCKDLVARLNLPISSQELMEQKQNAYLQIMEKEVKPKPGLIDLLNKLQTNHYKLAVASGSALHEIKIIVKALRIENLFETLCSSEEVKQGKPAPDVFLLAAKRMNLTPQVCLVLEDATSGIEAAKNAEMLRYAIPSQETIGQSFALANRVLNSLSEVYDCIVLDSKQ